MNIRINRKITIYLIIFVLVFMIIAIEANRLIDAKTGEKYNFRAYKGTLDLSNWDIDTQPIISLEGEWLFYHERFLEPDVNNGVYSDHGYINVPDLWNDYELEGKKIGAKSYGTYGLTILLPESPREKLALKIPDMSSSYTLYVNGEEISSNGNVGKSHDEEVPHWKPLVRNIGDKSGQLDILVHVSNFHHMKGGMWESILIGSEEAIYKNRELNLMISLILLGILLISAFYYLIIFSVMKEKAASLYLALFCLMAALREFLIREVAANLVFPNIPFGLFSKLEYITVPSGPILLALSLYGLYPKVFPKKILKIVISPFLAYIAIIIFTPLTVFGHLMNPCLILFILSFIYLFTIIIAAARKNEPGAGLLLFGTFIMLITAAIDMAYANRIHSDYNIAYTFSIGFIIFILCQMHSLSLIIADMFEKAQKLSKAELAFLQAQIVPHFLYNTLNTIIYLTRESPEKARNLLLKFSSYLRGKFDFKMYNQNLFVSLENELELVKSYLSIEKVRFDGRLDVAYNIDKSAQNCNIIPFVLQPLVENAMHHGLKNKTENCRIAISASRRGKHIIISIEDNGIGMPKEKLILLRKDDPTKNDGTGLYNVNQRLKAVYGTGLEIISDINKGTVINIKIPIREEREYAKSYTD